MRPFFNLLILLILILNFSCTIQGQKNNQNKETNRENTFTWKKDSSLIEALFERYSGEQAGVSFVVIQDGEILAKKSYGYADLKNRIIATEHTNYRTASATKQFTAMAIMMLIHQKKISYSSKLTDIFDDFPEYGNKITVKHLLVHRSGLVDYMNLMEENRSDQILDPEVLSLMKSQNKTLFEPGSMYEYSNSGYAVLSEIISKVSGLPFAEYMRNNIFEPLGMMNTFVYEKGVTIPNRAYGYTELGRSFRKTDQSTTSAVQGDGGIYTSVADYQKWDEALTNDQLIPSKEFEEALIAVYDNPVLNVQKYGHGWRIDYVNGIKKTHHSGHTKGFTNYTLRIPESGFCFAAFSNRNNEDAIIRIGNTIAALYSEGRLPVDASSFVESVFDKEGTDKAIERYKEIKEKGNYLLTENTLLLIGKKLLKAQKTTEAIKILTFNTEEFPASFESFYELANCYFNNNESDKASKMYKKARTLIPDVYRKVFEGSNGRIK